MRERLQRGVGADRAGAVAMRGAEDDARERQRRDRRRVVARLEQRRQPLLAQAIELRLRKRRPQRDVGHERQRGVQPRRPAR